MDVYTGEELEKAINNKEELIILHGDIAEKIVNSEKIFNAGKIAVYSLIAAGVAAGILAVSFPPVVPAMAAFGFTAAEVAGGFTAAQIAAIGAIATLGVTVLFAVFKDYNVDVSGKYGDAEFECKLRRKK